MTGPPFSDSILFCFIFFPSEQKCRVDDDKNGTGIVYESADDRMRIPVTARMMAIKFSVIENVRFRRMTDIILFERRRRWGSSFMSSSTRAISAASTAMSLPIFP